MNNLKCLVEYLQGSATVFEKDLVITESEDEIYGIQEVYEPHHVHSEESEYTPQNSCHRYNQIRQRPQE